MVEKYRGEAERKQKNFTKFYETSSKTNENIEDMFKDFVLEIYKKNKNKILENRMQNKKLYEVLKKENSGSCC